MTYKDASTTTAKDGLILFRSIMPVNAPLVAAKFESVTVTKHEISIGDLVASRSYPRNLLEVLEVDSLSQTKDISGQPAWNCSLVLIVK